VPAEGNGPWPTIVMIHGYGGDKGSYEASSPSDGFNNVGLAKKGYAVVTISTRGFGLSCGKSISRTAACDGKGWIHLDDQRFEVRDVQTLLGKLVDDGTAEAAHLGATGGSYGGGLSLQLAYLKNRVRMPNGAFAAWKSPAGTPLKLAAAYPVVPWSDLSSALVPNGRSDGFADPVGVPIKSYISGLYVAGSLAGWVADPGVDPGADLSGWKDLLDAGEPYTAKARKILKQISDFHGVWNLKGTPAPLLMASGWTDDLFPPVQTVRVYDRLRKHDKKAPVWLQVGDFGHARGGHHQADQDALNTQAASFFAHYLQGSAAKLPKPGSVLAFGQTCPNDTPNGLGPFTASSFAGLQKGSVTVRSGAKTTITGTATPEQAALNASLEPTLAKGSNACSTYKVFNSPNAATASRTKAFTYLGFGHVSVTLKTSGPYGQLNARLWDIAPGGDTQTLVDRSVYRLTKNQKGTAKFDLHGNGYRFAAGHTVRLEVVGNDAPTHRASNGSFSVKISNLKVVLPTR